jgi:hypothetical protein
MTLPRLSATYSCSAHPRFTSAHRALSSSRLVPISPTKYRAPRRHSFAARRQHDAAWRNVDATQIQRDGEGARALSYPVTDDTGLVIRVSAWAHCRLSVPRAAPCVSAPADSSTHELPLNRLSWLRPSPAFLHAIADAPSTRWLLFRGGSPLLAAAGGLARLPTPAVLPLLGQGQHDGDDAATGVRELDAARLRGAPAVFLGLAEPAPPPGAASSSAGAGALPSADLSAKRVDAAAFAQKVQGTPFFALDASDVPAPATDATIGAAGLDGDLSLAFVDVRGALGKLGAFGAGLFAEARSMVD